MGEKKTPKDKTKKIDNDDMKNVSNVKPKR